jgi:hypothetical protein
LFNAREKCSGRDDMLLTIGVFITVTAVVIVHRMRVSVDRSAPNLGWMSEQWLAEHRASHLFLGDR